MVQSIDFGERFSAKFRKVIQGRFDSGGIVEALNHHVSGLDESRGGIALSIAANALAVMMAGSERLDGEHDFGEEAFDADAYDFAD